MRRFLKRLARSGVRGLGVHRGEPAGRKPRGRRRQDLLLLQRGGERIRLLRQHHRVEDRSRVQGEDARGEVVA